MKWRIIYVVRPNLKGGHYYARSESNVTSAIFKRKRQEESKLQIPGICWGWKRVVRRMVPSIWQSLWRPAHAAADWPSGTCVLERKPVVEMWGGRVMSVNVWRCVRRSRECVLAASERVWGSVRECEREWCEWRWECRDNNGLLVVENEWASVRYTANMNSSLLHKFTYMFI